MTTAAEALMLMEIERRAAEEVRKAPGHPSRLRLAWCFMVLRFARDPVRVARARGVLLGFAWRLHDADDTDKR